MWRRVMAKPDLFRHLREPREATNLTNTRNDENNRKRSMNQSLVFPGKLKDLKVEPLSFLHRKGSQQA